VTRDTQSASIAVEVWHADLDAAVAALHELAATLSDDEHARAARFVFERDRRRFVASRGLLRHILGRRLGMEPSSVRLEYGERGKPMLAAGQGDGRLRFNVAHSQGHGLFALAAGPALGADIEVLRPLPDAMAIAERFFSPDERAALLARPAAERNAAFFLCWTRKEAYIKGLGTGLTHPLDRFSVSLEPSGFVGLIDYDRDGPHAWSLHDASRLPTYAAAVAVASRPDECHLRVRELPVDGIPPGW
jgi:4'-phosphopantetheinyl transferase